jgi:hypothetical protein
MKTQNKKNKTMDEKMEAQLFGIPFTRRLVYTSHMYAKQ